MKTRGDTHPTVRITFTERHLILMVITGERLQNLQNIINAVVIKVDCQSVWQSACLPRVLSSLQERSLETIRSFEICWNDKDVYFGSELHQNVTEWLQEVHTVWSLGHYSQFAYEWGLRCFCLWGVFNTSTLLSKWPGWSCDLCHVFKDTSIIYGLDWKQ